MLADHAKAMQRVCFGAEPSEADLELLGSRERWLVYRDLVRNRLNHVIRVALARTRDAIGEDTFARAVDEWFSAGSPKTRYLRHIPGELAEFAIPIWQRTEAPWVADLAGYEITTWDVRHAPADPCPRASSPSTAGQSSRPRSEVLRLAYPVQTKPTPGAGYEPDPTILCLYRDRDHRPIPRKLNPLAADLLEAWRRADQTVAESVQRVAAAHHTQIGPEFIEKLSTLIADLMNEASS